MRFPSPASVFLLFALLLPLGSGVRAQGNRLTSIEAFYSPMAAKFAPDGRTLYVVNGARGDYGMLAGRGSISRCLVSDEGTVRVREQEFAKGLNAPVDVSILESATSVSPPGALLVAVGGSWTTDLRGRPLEDDRARGTGMVVIHPDSGEVVGRLYLGPGSPVEGVFGRSIMDPYSVASDAEGNFYLADFAARGTLADAPGSPQPGLWKLNAPAVEALLQENEPPAGSVQFFPVRAIPTGILYSSRDRALYFVTGFEGFDLGGALLRLPEGDFSGRRPLETVAKELKSLNGIGITPKGTMLVTRNSGDILYIRGRRGREIRFRDKTSFLSPGQLAATTLANGRTLVVVPEASGGGSSQWRHRVKTFELPGDI